MLMSAAKLMCCCVAAVWLCRSQKLVLDDDDDDALTLLLDLSAVLLAGCAEHRKVVLGTKPILLPFTQPYTL
jgi:hypothetical protein